MNYKVKDISLADWGRKEINLAEAEMPAAAIAAAAWSCVEKILQELHVTSAPNSTKVSMSTAV